MEKCLRAPHSRITAGIFAIILSLFTCPAAFADAVSTSEAALVQGYECFRTGDWNSASFFLRKALTSPSNSTPETLYMLIMSQVYSENYSGAVSDCGIFYSDYSDSPLLPYVQFQKGKCQYKLDQLDSAVMTLSDFCHQNPDSDLYSSALFLIAECFYQDYNFETARALYEALLSQYPDDPKVQEANYRIDTIDQREREQKLLYLLKMTGEEYLSARESYEKQLKQYQTEDMLDLRRQLNLANQRILELEKAASDSLAQTPSASDDEQAVTPAEDSSSRTNEELEELRKKADQILVLMDYLNAN